jgi:hypothetical protein
VLGDVNEDHVVPELQFLESLHRLMITAEAMHFQRRFAARSCMANGLCWLASRRSRGESPWFAGLVRRVRGLCLAEGCRDTDIQHGPKLAPARTSRCR